MKYPLAIKNPEVNEEIDYLYLKDVLKSYAHPRAKITSLLRSHHLIRVKKGLYVFAEAYARKPFVKETLANLIYGPSYISLEYALSYYGMIPERVEIVTSVTNKKDKLFKTPVGTFSYRYLHPDKYPLGITQIMFDETHAVLIAAPEKALADKVLLSLPSQDLKNEKEVKEFLLEDLRIPSHKLRSLNRTLLHRLAQVYQNHNVSLLVTALSHGRK